jgi:uncharacterized protein YjbI with pentapeptide repeats
MELVNESGLEAAWIVSQIQPPAFALTVIVKGTFQLGPGKPALRAEKQLPLTGDKFESDDPTKSLRYPFDFAPFKPRADVLLAGTCYAPGGQPAEAVTVGLRVGAMSKSLVVCGDREWTARSRATAPKRFATMPLTWERAFGGPGFDRNPLGKGFKPIQRPDGTTVHPLPNLEAPGRLLQTWSDKGEPAGCGPLPDTWPQRLKKFGSFDARYMKERWPGYPHNFDWGFFNTAPEDQQIAGYLRGDEEFAAENMHPTTSRYSGRLPGLHVRSFVNELVRAKTQLREILMCLDTLWLEIDAERLVLVWRGHVPVRTEKLLEVFHLLVATEPMSQGPGALERYRLLLFDALERREEEDEELEEEEEPEEEEEEKAEEEETGEEPEEEVEAAPPPAPTVAEREAEEPEPEEPEDEDDPAEDEDELTVDRVKEMIAQRLSFEGCDLTGLALTGLDFSGLIMREAIFAGTVLVEANLSNADLGGAVLTGANLRKSKCLGTNFVEADLTDTRFVQADLSGADLTGADLTKAHLRGAKLRGVKAAEAVFCEADLSDANLEEADLSAADLCDSRLHRANLTRANLSDAALENAWGRNLKAPRAILNKLRGANAHLCEADFRESSGDDSVWEFAELYAANFTGASLNRAEFSGAYLGEAIFDAATVKEARFGEAKLRRARLVRCNLYETSLGKADLTEADLSESNLFGATLMDSVIEKTSFKGANLRRIKNRQEIK